MGTCGLLLFACHVSGAGWLSVVMGGWSLLLVDDGGGGPCPSSWGPGIMDVVIVFQKVAVDMAHLVKPYACHVSSLVVASCVGCHCHCCSSLLLSLSLLLLSLLASVVRSYQCPPNFCRNPVILVESGGIKFGRKASYFFSFWCLLFQRNLGIPELRLECSAEFAGTECKGIRLFVCLFVSHLLPNKPPTKHCVTWFPFITHHHHHHHHHTNDTPNDDQRPPCHHVDANGPPSKTTAHDCPETMTNPPK